MLCLYCTYPGTCVPPLRPEKSLLSSTEGPPPYCTLVILNHKFSSVTIIPNLTIKFNEKQTPLTCN